MNDGPYKLTYCCFITICINTKYSSIIYGFKLERKIVYVYYTLLAKLNDS